MTDKRALIEVYLPIEEISKEAKEEKKPAYHPPTSDMVFYWTRKPLITARATILGSLLPADFNRSEFNEYLGLNKNKRAFKVDLSSAQLETIKSSIYNYWGLNDITILDPFAGGGSIPFEALRLGFNAVGNDYNPLSWIIMKGAIEYPVTYGNKIELFNLVNEYIDDIINRTKRELGHLYPKHKGLDVAAYNYAWVVKCPNCNFEVPLVSQWRLFNGKKNNKINASWDIENDELKLKLSKTIEAPQATISDGKSQCINCGYTIDNDTICKAISKEEKELPISLVLLGDKHKEFDLFDKDNLIGLEKSRQILRSNWDSYISDDLIPLDDMPLHTVRAAKYLGKWHRLFNPRQLLLFITLVRNAKNIVDEIRKEHGEDTAKIISVYLAFLIGKHINVNSRLNYYNVNGQNISIATSNKLNAIQWNHTEVNPFVQSSGSLLNIKKYLLNGLRFSIDSLIQGNNSTFVPYNYSIISWKPDRRYKFIVTDPPYKDDVPYSELSDFFYVWEQKILEPILHNENARLSSSTTPKEESIDQSFSRSEKHFKRSFKLAFKNIYNILDDDGILTVFFAHSSLDAWDFVINALIELRFRISATWPMHTEYSANISAMGKASLMSSIVIVARKRKSDKSGYIEEIQEDIKEYLGKRLEEFWSYGLRGADLTVSAMGATLDVITQYSEVKSYTGEMNIRDMLQLVQGYVSNYVLSRYIQKPSQLDTQTSFYLYIRLNQMDEMPFDTSNLISKSLNIDLKKLQTQGIIRFISSGVEKGVKVITYHEREQIGLESLIDAVHLVMVTFSKGGYAEIERVLSDIPYSKNEIKDILIALLALPPDDPERQISQKILERMGYAFPKKGQSVLEDF